MKNKFEKSTTNFKIDFVESLNFKYVPKKSINCIVLESDYRGLYWAYFL